MSTETPWALSSGRYLMVLVNPNQEYGDTEAVNCGMGMGEVRGRTAVHVDVELSALWSDHSCKICENQ